MLIDMLVSIYVVLCGDVGFTHCDVIMLLAFVTP